MLAVADVRRAVEFYTAAFGYKVRGIMDTPQGVMHAELTLRGTTLMLSPEAHQQGSFSANALGNTPATLYVLVEKVDDVFAAAVAAGGRVLMPVMDQFWGDRSGMISDPDGNKWMIATHKSEPTEAEMAEAMRQMAQQPQAAAAAGAGD
jgi:PhnB protein